MPINYTSTGMESLIDYLDTGVNTVSTASVDLFDGSQSVGSSLILVTGSVYVINASTAWLFYRMKNSSGINSGHHYVAQVIGSTSRYSNESISYNVYHQRYMLRGGFYHSFAMWFDLRHNNENTPYDRITNSTEAMGYSQYGPRGQYGAAARVDNISPHTLQFDTSAGAFYAKIKSYAICANQ